MTTPNTPTRTFRYGQHEIPDPGAAYTPDQVRQQLVTYFPELAQAKVEKKELPDGRLEYSFVKQVTTKGSGDTPPPADLTSEIAASLKKSPHGHPPKPASKRSSPAR